MVRRRSFRMVRSALAARRAPAPSLPPHETVRSGPPTRMACSPALLSAEITARTGNDQRSRLYREMCVERLGEAGRGSRRGAGHARAEEEARQGCLRTRFAPFPSWAAEPDRSPSSNRAPGNGARDRRDPRWSRRAAGSPRAPSGHRGHLQDLRRELSRHRHLGALLAEAQTTIVDGAPGPEDRFARFPFLLAAIVPV